MTLPGGTAAALIIISIVVAPLSALVAATRDTNNRFPEVGALVFWGPIGSIRPATFAKPGSLADAQLSRQVMTVVGYGSTAPVAPESRAPISSWDGARRFRNSALDRVINDYWGMWRLPSRVCFGDSGAPTFIEDHRCGSGARRLVAVVSDGGADCASRDARARVDTKPIQDWIVSTFPP